MKFSKLHLLQIFIFITFQDQSECSSPPISDRVEVIKLPPTNGSPSGISIPSFSGTNSNNFNEASSDGPLNLSLKPTTNSTNHSSSSLNSLSNMSANIGMERVCKYFTFYLLEQWFPNFS